MTAESLENVFCVCF